METVPLYTSPRILTVSAILLVIILFSASLRLTNLPEWHKHPQRSFMHDGRPVLIEFDGYLYLRYARDIVEKSYAADDQLRNFPKGLPRPYPPPLLSLFIATASRIGPFPIDHVGAWLPVIVGACSSLAFFWLGSLLSGPLGGYAAALGGAASPFFVTRSQYAHLDTDCGIPVFVALLGCLAYSGFFAPGKKRGLYLLGFTLVGFLFYLWWNTATPVVIFIGLAFIACAALGKLTEFPQVCVTSLVLGSICLVYFLSSYDSHLVHLGKQLIHQLDFASGKVDNVISEQTKFSFSQNMEVGFGHAGFFFLTILGILAAFILRPKVLCCCFPLLLLGLLPFLWYHRFLLFASPCIALGCAGLVCWANRMEKHFRALHRYPTIVVLLFTIAGVGLCAKQTCATVEWPVLPPYSCFALEEAGKHLPDQAIIWSWWDNGYHIQYYARRATIEDGGNFMFPEITAFPLVIADEHLAAQWMYWITEIGPDNAKTCLNDYGTATVLTRLAALSPDQTDAGLSPECFPEDQFSNRSTRKPVYLFLNHIYLHSAHWWYWYGSSMYDDDVRHRHGVLKPFYGLEKSDDLIRLSEGTETFFLRNGHLAKENIHVSQAHIKADLAVTQLLYPSKNNLIFQADLDNNWSAIMDSDLFHSVFNRLYFLPGRKSPYFYPAAIQTPQFQLWQVTPDLTPDLMHSSTGQL